MSNLNKLYLFAILTFAGVGIFFIGKHYSKKIASDSKITNAAALLKPETSNPLIEAGKASGGEAQASIPEEFDLEKQGGTLIGEEAKLALSSSAIRATFPQNKGDLYRWSPLDGYVIEGTVDSIQRGDNSKSFGVTLKNDVGRFVYYENQARAGAIIFFNKRNAVHRFSHSSNDENEWTIEEVPYHDVDLRERWHHLSDNRIKWWIPTPFTRGKPFRQNDSPQYSAKRFR